MKYKKPTERELLVIAIDIASIAHDEQYDKSGKPYILHPLRIMNGVDSYVAKMVAVMHDVLEDSDYIAEDLEEQDFPSVVIEALELLTHVRNTPYKDYIKQIKTSRIATEVKIADLMDNTDPVRLENVYRKDPKTALRLAKKYLWALEYLK